jgi:hypothetical protein
MGGGFLRSVTQLIALQVSGGNPIGRRCCFLVDHLSLAM